jgi:DNA-binding CsgD family transcriptional regulator
MVAEGRSSKEIAGLLGIAPRTVEHHRVHVRHKLGLRDVASLTRFAIRAGLIAG